MERNQSVKMNPESPDVNTHVDTSELRNTNDHLINRLKMAPKLETPHSQSIG